MRCFLAIPVALCLAERARDIDAMAAGLAMRDQVFDPVLLVGLFLSAGLLLAMFLRFRLAMGLAGSGEWEAARRELGEAVAFRNVLDALPRDAMVVRPATVEAVVLPPIDTSRHRPGGW